MTISKKDGNRTVMALSPNSLVSLRCRTRQMRIITSISGWLVIVLIIFPSFEHCNSQNHELQSLQSYHQLPHLHPGVVRDFEALLLEQERQESHHPYNDVSNANLEKSGTRSEANAFESIESLTDRSLQDEISFCYDALYLADQNQDNKVDGDEFVTFAQILGPPGFLPNLETYQELPLILQSNFIILACLCLQIPDFGGGTGINQQCCAVDPHIDISGTRPGQIPTSKESQYLYQVCFLTETSIDRLLLSATPTPVPSSNTSPNSVITDPPTDKPPPSHEPTQDPTGKPTIDPTLEMTFEPTIKPTVEPSTVPTLQPTDGPTSEPSVKPSSNPTTEPSQKPTGEPTNVPTGEPTNVPTGEPTNVPTKKPTSEEPSAKPSRNRTIEPSGSPTEIATDSSSSLDPTSSPSLKLIMEPTTKPSLEDDNVSSPPVSVPSLTPEPVTQVAIVNYGIAITNANVVDIPFSSFMPDLIKSMDIVAGEVGYAMNLGERENRFRGLKKGQQYVDLMRRSVRLNQRKLATVVTVNLPTAIERLTSAECPPFIPSNDDCQTVMATVELSITVDEDTFTTGRQDYVQGLTNPTAAKDLFQENLNMAIENGALQAALIEVNRNSIVTVTTGFVTTTPSISPTPSDIVTLAPTSEPVPVSPGGIAGIVLAGVSGLIIGFVIIAALRRKGLEASDGNLADQFEQDVEEAGQKATGFSHSDKEDGNFGEAPSPTIVQSNQSPTTGDESVSTGVAVVTATAVVGTTAALAATSSPEQDDNQTKLANAGGPGNQKRPPDTLYEVPGAKAMVVDDASSAGESGWSSNQDGSSANTSIDNSLDSIPQSNFSGMSPIVLGVGIEGETLNEMVEEAVSSLESPARSRPSIELEQTSYVSQSTSPAASQSPQSQANSQDISYSGTTGTDGSIQSTYSELDEAIQKGDWAAVGVTAALLASQAYVDDNTLGSSKYSNSLLRRQNASLNPERAAELDRLVETGDWEGVVAAAAKFDAQEALRGDAHSSQNSESGSAVDSTGGSNTSSARSGSVGGSSVGTAPSNMSGSQTIDTTTSPSTYTATGLTATSDTASTRSKARKLNEIRDEVEALVTAVVPEEADNVDEMMTQFRGREEELVETLRSMQERQVAQKARKESQKQAKRQAKEYVQDKKKQETFEAVDNTGTNADDIWMKEIEDFDVADGDRGVALEVPMEANEKAKAMKDQLKEAINNENWENVAEAAAGLSGQAFSKVKKSSKDNESVVSNCSVDINALVDKGDWDGVVAAASKYAESSTNASSSNEYTQEDTEELPDDSTIEERRKRREERLKEEEEALAQAQIWDAIADQTKADDNQKEKGSLGNAGAAKMAADWAIDQSLAALQKAEEEHDDNSQDSSQDEKGDNESL